MRIRVHALAIDPKRMRRGFALLTTILLLTLLVAVSAQLVTATSTQAVSACYRHQTLTHELAVDSAILLLTDALATARNHPSELIDELDRYGEAYTRFQIGPTTVQCVIRDDGAKLSPLPFQRPDQSTKLARKLARLGAQRSLPAARIALKPVVTKSASTLGQRYLWYDQVLSDVQPGALFRWNETSGQSHQAPIWSDVVTFAGDGRIDLRRVDVDVLEAALEDIRPGLARSLLAARPQDRSIDFMPAALTRVPAEIRQQLAAFAHHLQANDPTLRLSGLNLANRRADTPDYDVDLAISYLVYAPRERGD